MLWTVILQRGLQCCQGSGIKSDVVERSVEQRFGYRPGLRPTIS